MRPLALQNRPKLRVTDVPFADAFFALHAARTFGAAAPNPISIAEVWAYVSFLGIASREERAKYLRLIQLLDRVYLAHWADKNPSPGSQPGKGSKNNQNS